MSVFQQSFFSFFLIYTFSHIDINRHILHQVILFISLSLSATSGNFFTVKRGDEVTLNCENAMDNNCDGTKWKFAGSRGETRDELIIFGQIGEAAKSKSDRLSVTKKCSLVIKKVTDEDAGRYYCEQYDKSGDKLRSDSLVRLSVISSEYLHHHVFSSNCETLQ